MRSAVALTLVLFACLGAAQAAKSNTGSLYDQTGNDAYFDRVARKKGDILMVVIDEAALSTFTASTKTNKAISNSTVSNVLSAINQIFGPFSNGATHTMDGGGTSQQNSKMSARMSVVVTEVDSAGNLLIEGTRSLVTNKDTQTYVLTGTVRPFDIAPDNTVVSTKVANAKITMAGKGQIADRQRKGVLTTILDWLF
jgi:flagellar L-ring protein precursor FlgH